MRVATNLKKDDGSRAIGTILDPNGPALRRGLRGKLYRRRAFEELGLDWDEGINKRASLAGQGGI